MPLTIFQSFDYFKFEKNFQKNFVRKMHQKKAFVSENLLVVSKSRQHTKSFDSLITFSKSFHFFS